MRVFESLLICFLLDDVLEKFSDIFDVLQL